MGAPEDVERLNVVVVPAENNEERGRRDGMIIEWRNRRGIGEAATTTEKKRSQRPGG